MIKHESGTCKSKRQFDGGKIKKVPINIEISGVNILDQSKKKIKT